MENEPIKIFIAYSRTDGGMLEELRKQFNPLEINGKVTVWYDGEIRPGEKWDMRIQDELHAAEIILLLVSPDSISSKYFYESEVQKAIKRDEEGETKVIPVILRPCLWQETPLGKLQALPENGNDIINWIPIDSGYFNVVESIKRIVDALLWERKFEKHPETIVKTKGTLHFLDLDGNRVEFDGEIINGKANGFGVARALGNNYYKYEGHYSNNLRHDQKAIMIWSSGHKYEGSFQNDKRTGKGKFKWDNGFEYEGDFLDNAVTGHGLYKTPDFDYEGEMKGQSPHRKGKMVNFKEKYTYEGEFWEGIKRGKGKIMFENGLTYEGDFLEGQQEGIGRRVLPNGVIYEGEFRKGKAHGLGRMFTERFEIYKGIFKEDKAEDFGLLVDENGNRFEYKGEVPIKSFDKEDYKVIFYNGDVLERRREYSDRYPYIEGTYSFSSGIKVKFVKSFSNFIIKCIEFPNGASVYGRFGDLRKENDEAIFDHFFVFKTYDPNPNDLDEYEYIWPDGNSINLSSKKFKVDETTGELLDKNYNKIESNEVKKLKYWLQRYWFKRSKMPPHLRSRQVGGGILLHLF